MTVLTETDRALLAAFAARITPESAALGAPERGRFFALIDGALSSRAPAMVRQFRFFLRAANLLPFVRFGAPFTALDAPRQDAFLRWLHGCPIALLRQGFWGLKTLVYLGYYGRPELGPSLGYLPSKTGNDRLHAG